jgi:hypothetical protein
VRTSADCGLVQAVRDGVHIVVEEPGQGHPAEACPSIRWTAPTFVPFAARRIAAVCRRSCAFGTNPTLPAPDVWTVTY